MGHKTLARNRAIGTIGAARVAKLEDAGLLVVDRDEWMKATERRAELETEVKRLRTALAQGPETVAAQVLREAMVQ